MGEDVLMGIRSLLEEWMERIKNLTISQLPAVGGAPLSHPHTPISLGALWFWLRLVSRSELSCSVVAALTP